MILSHIFRAYDIRGIVDSDFDEQGAMLIGSAYATFLKQHNPKAQVIAVGRDGRIHSPRIKQAFIEGVIKCGIEVCDIGEATSPLLNFAIHEGNFDGGVNITASHNPKEYNGFKLQKEKAHAIFGEDIETIGKLALCNKINIAQKKGIIFKQDFSQKWLNKIKSIINIKNSPKIAIDCGNGIGGKFAYKLFTMLGCEVLPIYCEVDGNFPNHEANPEIEANLQDLKNLVIKNNCLLGVAFDGDGDRVGIVDQLGKAYAADLLLLILARDLLTRHPNAGIVYDLKATQVLADEISKLGGKPIMCKTGHSFVENSMRKNKALLGGEVSGHIFIAENYYGFDDAFVAAAKLIEIITNSEITLKEHFQDLPKTFVTPEIKIPIEENVKFSICQKIVNYFVNKYSDKVLTIDGARIDFGEGAWGIIRASNTSPYLTTRFEARSEIKLISIQKEIFAHLKQYKEIKLANLQ